MTRKDYELIARLVREGMDRANDGEGSQPHRGGERAALHRFATNFAAEEYIGAGFDTNGNRRFKTDRFMKACGF